MQFVKIQKIMLVALLVGGLVGCKVAGELQEDTRTIELGKAESVELRLNMAAGVLRLQGGAGELMESYFKYNIDRWKPEVGYSLSGSRGILKVKQGKSSGMTVGKKRNIWEIRLSNDVPMDIKVNLGAGQSKLDLRGLMLESLNVDMGVGELTVDLSGEQNQNLDVVIDGGIGSATLYLPRHIGVRVSVDGGLGSVNARGMNKKGNVYTNETYGKTDISIEIDIDAGIGSIDLELK